jgi:hypothetical protein
MLMATMYGFWVASWIGASVLIAYILKKKLNREFPIFFAYLVAGTVSDLLNFVLSFISYRDYYYTYWTGTAVTIALGFAVLHEVFKHIFRPYESLRTFGSNLFRWSTLVLLMIGAVMALSSAPATHSPITNFIFTIDRSVNLMQCGLVLFMYLFARQLGLTEGHRVFGISIGFGVIASTHLIAVTLRSHFPGMASMYVLNIVNLAANLAAVITWMVYMYRPEPERRRASVLEQTESWNYALAAATNGDGGSAFLPNVVDTVERVLNKRSMSISSEFRPRG